MKPDFLLISSDSSERILLPPLEESGIGHCTSANNLPPVKDKEKKSTRNGRLIIPNMVFASRAYRVSDEIFV